MANDDVGQEDRTEEATPERRDDFRERGQVVVSREFSSVAVLAGCVAFASAYLPNLITSLERMFVTHFESVRDRRVDNADIFNYLSKAWVEMLWVILPLFLVTLVVATGTTFFQTRLNWSWERLKPDFSRMNILSGLARMVNLQAGVELLKSIAKMLVVSLVAYAILFGEWAKVPELMNYPMLSAWKYWGGITKTLFWAVAGLLLFVAAADYLFNFLSFERKIKMTKQEVKEDYKKREVDPHVKNRMRRMQRDMVMKKTLTKTKSATVLITNPTHYSIALQYELGDRAPKLVAKGIDFLALQMREIAKEEKIPIIENRPLARALYAQVKEGEEIPDAFYKTVAEIIRYVFKLKGRRLPTKNRPAASAIPIETPVS